MTLVMGMDQHRAQIAAEWIDTTTGEIFRARIRPADRAGVRKFLTRFKGQGLEVALEATTGWRFLVEELERVGAEAHLAEVVQTSGLKGRGKRPKTDWADARHLRELLLIGRLPEAWIAPAHLLDLRARVRCRHTLVHQRTEWQQRMQAVLYHHGIPQARDLFYGVYALTSVTILAELGDTRRFENSRDAVRYGGMDITVHQSDAHRAPGHLSRQGPPALRWALYEAAQRARFPASPDRAYYEQLAARIGGNRACLAIARKRLKRSYHLLRALGDDGLKPVTA
ncbi:MAG: transposase [Solirubrobacteraceae bacterium]